MANLWRELLDAVTYRDPGQNPTLARRGQLGADFAGWPVAVEFGAPPAVVYAKELKGLDDLALIRGPQRRSPGHRVAVGSR